MAKLERPSPLSTQPVPKEQAAVASTPTDFPDIDSDDFQRVPFGSANQQLAATEIPGYHLHWINDWHPSDADRLQKAMRAGYRFVTSQEVETAPLLGAPSTDLGNRVSRTVGTRPTGEPITAFLMKIPTQWWHDHQKQVWERADQVDNAIRGGARSAKVEQGYDPKGDKIRLSNKLQ